MLDYQRLQEAYDNGSIYSLQLVAGDGCCGLVCSYCYFNALEQPSNTLRDGQILYVLDETSALEMTAVEWLGCEPLLRNSIFDFMERVADFGLRNNMWTGGVPLMLDIRRVLQLPFAGLRGRLRNVRQRYAVFTAGIEDVNVQISQSSFSAALFVAPEGKVSVAPVITLTANVYPPTLI
jgi:uncharacterized radical SAM superfamily Fe-S cluster-containing enzyme